MKQFRVTCDKIWAVEIVERIRHDETTYCANVCDETYELIASFSGTSTREAAERLAISFLQRKGKVTEV